MALGHLTCAQRYLFYLLTFNIVSRNYCYWRMYFWQLILYPLVNIWLFVAFHCQIMCVLLSFSFILESSTLWPRVLYQEFCWNHNWTLSCLILISHFFSSVGLNSVCIELFVNTRYFINVFFVYKLNRRHRFLKHRLCKCGFCSV